MEIKKEVNWNDLKENSWSGAVPVCEEIEKQGREDEAMSLISEVFYGEVPDETQVNDFIWFDLADMLHLYDPDDDEADDPDDDDEA